MALRHETEKLFGKTLNPDGSLRAVSPSQAITFKRCGLRWHFDKKGKLQKKPMGKGASIGDAAHGRTETFLKTGQDVRGPLELVGAEMLKPYLWAAPFMKGPGVVEGALLDPRLQTPGGVLITGYFDFYIPGVGDTIKTWPIVIDHKFKKDLEKWADDEDDLQEDPQAITYMTWALMRQPDTDGAIFRHHNVQTEGPGGRYPLPVEVRMTRDAVLRKWGALAQTIDGPMREAALVPPAEPGATPDGVPFNVEACGDFGGCDFARTCKHSPQNRFVAALRGDAPPVSSKAAPTPEVPRMGLLSQINASAVPSTPQTAPQMVEALQGSIATLIPVAQAQPETVYILPPGSGGMVGRFVGMVGSRPVFRMKDGGLKDIDPTAHVRTTDAETVALFEGKPAPAVSHQLTSEPPKEPAPALDSEKTEKKRKLGIVDVVDPAPAVVAPPDVAPQIQGAGAPPEKAPSPAAVPEATQGAPSNANAAAAGGTPEVKVTTAEALAEAPKPEKKPRKKLQTEAPQATTTTETEPVPPPVESDAPLMLLINCACAKAVDLSGYVAKLAAEAASRYGAPDVRLGHQKTDLGYGGWKAILALEAAKNPPKGLCSITSSELADPIIEALTPIAALVVRGGVR